MIQISSLILIIVISGIIALLLTPLVKKIAQRLAILDYPNQRKIHLQPTPLLGGLAIYFSLILTIYFTTNINKEIIGLISASTLIVLLGLLDDFKNVSAKLRLLIQLFAALIIVLSGVRLNIIDNHTLSSFLEPLLTVLWIVGITNAFNFFDGMDGLSVGLGIICSLFFAIIAYQNSQTTVTMIAVALMGACLGFFPFNFKMKKNASIFLGDSGSTLIGFVLATLAVMGEWAENNPVKALSIPLLILGVLIFDMLYISIARIKTGKVNNFSQWLDYVGKDHLHHRLIAMDLSPKQCVLLIYTLTTTLGLAAVILKNGQTIDAVLGIFQMLLILLIVTILMRKGGERLVRKNLVHDLNKHGITISDAKSAKHREKVTTSDIK
ncbi:MAG: undecaprenyl/decaprenyl-phosphate alpha-N-acetylglucosaminyl 1-phosphate transferase [Calditrichaeota bacterium]|nr:MAG: undecaprenyl/decaprenyl-phosphate alpha-N-acetylglucosaminyl 1-phosphate transferase [Calditrichota bacterium]